MAVEDLNRLLAFSTQTDNTAAAQNFLSNLPPAELANYAHLTVTAGELGQFAQVANSMFQTERAPSPFNSLLQTFRFVAMLETDAQREQTRRRYPDLNPHITAPNNPFVSQK